MSRQRGFTLLEILVVLTIMVLVYAIVPPLFSIGGSTTELRAAARQLAAGLRKARGQAITSRQDATLTVNVEKHDFWVTGDKHVYDLPKGADLSVYTAKSETAEGKVASIRFFPDGSSTGGAISVSHGGNKFRVDVNWLTGEVTIRNGS